MRLYILALAIFISFYAIANDGEIDYDKVGKNPLIVSSVIDEYVNEAISQEVLESNLTIAVKQTFEKEKSTTEIVKEVLEASYLNKIFGDIVVTKEDISIYDDYDQYDSSCYKVDSHGEVKKLILTSNFCSSSFDRDNYEMKSITAALGTTYKINNGTYISVHVFDQQRSEDGLKFDFNDSEKGVMLTIKVSIDK